MKLLTTTLALIGLTSTAYADGTYCPVKIPPKKPVPQPCVCKGERGTQGPPGPKGDPGRDGKDGEDGITQVFVVPVRARPAIGVDLGVMGFASAPHGDWAWGPALGLTTEVNRKYDLRLNVGLAAGASDGRESGYMLELSGVRRLRSDLSGFLGVYYASIDGSVSNGNIDGSYLGLTGGITLDLTRRVRLEAGPTLTALRDDFVEGTQLALGMQGSLFVRLGR